jgi:hypothetical protein
MTATATSLAADGQTDKLASKQ